MQLRGRTPGGDAWAPGSALDPHVLRDAERRVPWPLIGWRAPPRITEERGWSVAAAPTIQAVGTMVAGNTSQSPAWPTHIVNDIGYCFVYARDVLGSAGVPQLSTSATFVKVPGSDAADAGGNDHFCAFWARATSNAMSTPTVSITGSLGGSYSSISAIIITVRGAILTGDPTEAVSTGANAGSSTAVSIAAGTTLGANRLVIAAVGEPANSATCTGWTNATLSGFTSLHDTFIGGSGHQSAAAGTKATGASWGTSTATMGSATTWVGIAVAVLPVADPGVGRVPTARADGRVWLKPGQFAKVQGSTEQNNGVAGSVPAPSFIARNPRPWLKPGQFARAVPSSQSLGTGVEAPPTPRPIPANQRPWLKPGFGARVQGSTVNPVPVGVRGASYWGPHFPRRRVHGARTFWNGHFPDGIPNTVPGVPPAGAGAFALLLESGAKVTYGWQTGLFKSYSGKERRSNLVDDPGQRFEGEAILVGDQTRAARVRLARYAALGTPFQLGLPYESLAITADSTGTTVHVNTTTLSDWAVAGCRVLVRRASAAGTGGVTFSSVEAVIQSVTANTIELDTTLGNVGLIGGEIMPEVAVYLDAQQAFARYQTPLAVERWQVKARNVNPGFMRSATWAQLALGGTATGVTLRAWTAGSAGNAKTVQFIADSTVGPYAEVIGNALVYHYRAGIDTVASMVGAIERTDSLYVIGARPDTIMTGGDAFGPTALSGGADAGPVPVGIGATVATFAGVPVWNRRLDDPDTVTDTIQSFAQAQDLGGLPFMAGMTAIADWGRDIRLVARLGAEWQWTKKFLDTVRARWKSFWLPSWRADLVATATGAGTLTVRGTENGGDVFAWYPAQRSYVQIWQADGTVTYARISAAVDNGNSTATLSIVDAASAPITLSGSAIAMVSWLERVRLEDDTVAVAFRDFHFELGLTARVMQQATEQALVTFADYEASVESSQPRIGIQIDLPIVTYRVTTNTRDVTIAGATYHAEASTHDEIRVSPIVDEVDGVTLTLPLAHKVSQAWVLGIAPPQRVGVTITLGQPVGSEVTFRGEIVSMEQDGHLAHFRVLSTFGRMLERRLPVHSVGRECPKVLGDADCTVNIEALKVAATVLAYAGTSLTLSTVGGHASTWAEGGKLFHVASNSWFTVSTQVGTTVVVHAPIVGLANGDAVYLYPGCAKDAATCSGKFDNMVNFGGQPQLPLTNPTRSPGFGVISS
jgi:hypothetical protein